MKQPLHRFLALFLSLSVFISAVGVAQVSHVCRMVAGGYPTFQKEQLSGGSHTCCHKNELANCKIRKSKNCCSTQVKYFQNHIQSTNPEPGRSLEVAPVLCATFPDNFNSCPALVLSLSNSFTPESPPGPPQRDIVILIQSFLI